MRVRQEISKKEKVLVYGHIVPDTDAICSPMAYALFLNKVNGVQAEAVSTGGLNRETAFVLDYFGIDKPREIEKVRPGEKVILLDTTKPEELVEGTDNADVLEILDHHKLGGFATTSPLDVTVRKVGSSATVVFLEVWSKVEDYVATTGDEAFGENMANLLVAGVISDTLNLKSTTTTGEDIEALERLSKVAHISVDSFAAEMFDAKSDLTGMSAREIVLMDAKATVFGEDKVIVGVVETVRPQNSLQMKDELLAEMDKIKQEKGLGAIFLFVIDILKKKATLLVAGETERLLAEKAFDVKISNDTVVLEGVVSRKKQIIPPLEKSIKRVE